MSRKRKQRQRLWNEAGGKCHWCSRVTVMPPDRPLTPGEIIPDHWATTDHLVHRYHPDRQAPTDGQSLRRVLACRRCNDMRGREDVYRNPGTHQRHMAAGPLRMRGQSIYEVVAHIPAPTNINNDEAAK